MLTGSANFRDPHYHRPADTPETLDYQRLAAVSAATAATAVFWAPPAPGPRASAPETRQQEH
jgi:hypothetical protein